MPAVHRPDPFAPEQRGPSRAVRAMVAAASLALAACNSDGRTLAPADAPTPTIPAPEAAQAAFIVTSPGFVDESPLPATYTCDGADVVPPLDFDGVPESAVELVLVVDDVDAGGRIHLFAAGLDPTLPGIGDSGIPADALVLENDFGQAGYTGPCPDDTGEHRYYFTLYALEAPSGLTDETPAFDARLTVGERASAIAVIEGRYGS